MKRKTMEIKMFTKRTIGFIVLLIMGLVAVVSNQSYAQTESFDPGNGQTLLLIGQNYQSEYQGYSNGTGLAPAGASVYGDIYAGAFNTDSQNLVNYLTSNYPNAYVMVGFSWKDNLVNNGYPLYRTVTIEEDIVNGQFNSQLDSIATYMKNRPNLKWLFRIDYEVSNNFHCNTDASQWNWDTKDCSYYHNAYNYIANRIRHVNGATNVDFVYHPRSWTNAIALPW